MTGSFSKPLPEPAADPARPQDPPVRARAVLKEVPVSRSASERLAEQVIDGEPSRPRSQWRERIKLLFNFRGQTCKLKLVAQLHARALTVVCQPTREGRLRMWLVRRAGR